MKTQNAVLLSELKKRSVTAYYCHTKLGIGCPTKRISEIRRILEKKHDKHKIETIRTQRKTRWGEIHFCDVGAEMKIHPFAWISMSILLTALIVSTGLAIAGGEAQNIPDSQKDCFELNAYPTNAAEADMRNHKYSVVVKHEQHRIAKLEAQGKAKMVRVYLVCGKEGKDEIVGLWYWRKV